MAAKAWNCLMPGCSSRFNDLSDPLRSLPANVCAGCGRGRYTPHALGAVILSVLIAAGAGVIWLMGMPARSYAGKYKIYIRNDGRIDEKEEIELAKIAEKYRLDGDDIARIQDDVRQQLGLNPKPPEPGGESAQGGRPRGPDKELIALLYDIYSDGIKSENEQSRLDDLARRLEARKPQLDEAEREIERRWRMARPDFERGLRMAGSRDYAGAAEAFNQSLETDGDNPWTLANLSAACLEAGRDAEAREAGEKALRADPRNWLAHYNLGSWHARRGEKDEAIGKLSNALSIVAEDYSQRLSRTEVAARMKADESLRSLRQDPRFQQLLAQQ